MVIYVRLVTLPTREFESLRNTLLTQISMEGRNDHKNDVLPSTVLE